MLMIVMTRELCAQQGCGFMLVPGQGQVQCAFEIFGLLDHLPFRSDVSDPPGRKDPRDASIA
jgi:hypothetical protein